MDSLFLRQVWAGNEAMLQRARARGHQLGARHTGIASRLRRTPRLHYFLINKGPWSRLDHNRVFVAGAPAQAGGGQLLSRRRHQGGDPALDRLAERRGQGARDRLLHDDPPYADGRLHRGALQRRVSGRARAGRGAAARGRRADQRSRR